MTFQSKRAWRLQEFTAHGGNVNCLALGPKSARVMVTGGEDRKVSLFLMYYILRKVVQKCSISLEI